MCRSLKIKSSSVILILVLITNSIQDCLNDAQTKKYFKVRNCYRSDATVLTKSNFNSLKECLNYAKDKQGLAVNYSPPEAKKPKMKEGEYFYNCQVLACPEVHNGTLLVNDTAYDYYSAYANLTVLENATCIKSLGMFKLFHTKENYTSAIETCQSIGADLAHVVSEQRTNALSNLVLTLTDWYKVAYIGLDDTEMEAIYKTALGDNIDCFKYRAWSPGHPRNILKSDDCVVIDVDKSWKVVNCKNKLPFLCEYFPTAQSSNGTSYRNVDCDDLDDSAERKECKAVKKIKKPKEKEGGNRCYVAGENEDDDKDEDEDKDEDKDEDEDNNKEEDGDNNKDEDKDVDEDEYKDEDQDEDKDNKNKNGDKNKSK